MNFVGTENLPPQRACGYGCHIVCMETASGNRESVIINVSPENSLLPNRKFKGEIEQFANKRLILVSDEQIDVSTGITAQSKDLLFMGVVLECCPGPDARWSVHVRVNRTLLVV